MKIQCIPCLLAGMAIGIAVLFGINFYINSLETETSDGIMDDTTMAELLLTSSAFEHNANIPLQYTCDGENISPTLSISGVDKQTKTLALVMDDPDIPEEVKKARGIEVFDHWVLFNLPSDTTIIKENVGSSTGVLGVNGAGETAYTGPCPPSEYEPTEHRYIFMLYALDIELDLSERATKEQVKDAMQGHILQKAELMGRYEREK